MDYVDDIEPYQNLANAIVAQAAHDYAQAIVDEDKGAIYTYIQFFASDWYKILTTAQPEAMLKQIKTSADEFRELAKEALSGIKGAVTKPKEIFKCPLCGASVRTRHVTATIHQYKGSTVITHYNQVRCLWCELKSRREVYTEEKKQ